MKLGEERIKRRREVGGGLRTFVEGVSSHERESDRGLTGPIEDSRNRSIGLRRQFHRPSEEGLSLTTDRAFHCGKRRSEGYIMFVLD